MLVTLECYLPETDKTIWVNCDGDSVGINNADIVWGEGNEDPYDACVICVSFYDDKPNEVKQWLPIINESLIYFIDQILTGYVADDSNEIPVEWLPNSILKNANPNYIRRLREDGEHAVIAVRGNLRESVEYIEWVIKDKEQNEKS